MVVVVAAVRNRPFRPRSLPRLLIRPQIHSSLLRLIHPRIQSQAATKSQSNHWVQTVILAT
jgi:hypothetical protein